MCRSGCKTQDHKSWGECARSAHISAQWLGGTGHSYGDEKEFYKIGDDYNACLDAGVDPGSFERSDIDAALRAADAK
jgi:hypothetical protein